MGAFDVIAMLRGASKTRCCGAGPRLPTGDDGVTDLAMVVYMRLRVSGHSCSIDRLGGEYYCSLVANVIPRILQLLERLCRSVSGSPPARSQAYGGLEQADMDEIAHDIEDYHIWAALTDLESTHHDATREGLPIGSRFVRGSYASYCVRRFLGTSTTATLLVTCRAVRLV